MIGALIVYFKPKKINLFLGLSLSFSGTIMLLISIFDLIPEGFIYLHYKYSIIYAILTSISMFIITDIIIYYFNKISSKSLKNSNSLYRVGILSMIALIIHNFPEGILTFLSSTLDLKIGLKMAFAIMLHNIPEGVAIAMPIYYSTHKKGRALLWTLISGSSEVIGAIFASIFIKDYLNQTLISYILLFVAGIMITISINEIYIEALKYPKKSFIYGVILGFTLFIISMIFA